MRIATWNVNSIRQRLSHVLDYLSGVEPDVLCLQELKCTDEAFPRLEVEASGYHCYVHGQKGFNGVAILTRSPAEATSGLAGDDGDLQARYMEAVVHDASARFESRPSICPMATRPTRTNTPTSWASWTD